MKNKSCKYIPTRKKKAHKLKFCLIFQPILTEAVTISPPMIKVFTLSAPNNGLYH